MKKLKDLTREELIFIYDGCKDLEKYANDDGLPKGFDFEDYNKYLFVYDEDKKIVGFLIIALLSEEDYIHKIFIKKEYRRQGYGKKLLKMFEEASEQGVISFGIYPRNERSIKFFQNYFLGEDTPFSNYYKFSKDLLAKKRKEDLE